MAVVEATPTERAGDANEHSNQCHRATIRSQAQRLGNKVVVASLYTPVWLITITTPSPS
jgi:hypothetical protein